MTNSNLGTMIGLQRSLHNMQLGSLMLHRAPSGLTLAGGDRGAIRLRQSLSFGAWTIPL